MRRWQTAVVTLAIVLGFVAAPVAGAIVNPRFEAYASEPLVTPGTATGFPVQVVNNAADPKDTARTAKQVRVTMRPGPAPVTVRSGTFVLDDVADGQSRDVTFDLVVPRDARPGTYRVPVEVRYEFDTRSVTDTVTVPLEVESVARFELVTADTSAGIGDTGTLSLTLRNVGAEVATDSRVVVESTDSELRFGAGGSSTEGFVGRWAPGETRTVDFKAGFGEDAIRRNYSLGVTVAFRDADGQRREDALSAGIRPLPRQSFRLVDVRSTAPIGGAGRLELAIENAGPAEVYESTVTVASQDADLTFAGGAAEAQSFVGSWEAGETKRLSYRLNVADRAVRRNYSIRATVAFEDAAGNQRTPRSLLASIRPGAEQTFAVEDVATDLSVGSTGTVGARVVNTGDAAVRDGVVVLQAEGSDLTPRAVEVPVGDLEPGAGAAVEYTLDVPDEASTGVRRLSLVVRYENDAGDTLESESLGLRAEVTDRVPAFGLTPVDTSFAVDSSGRLGFTLRNALDEPVSEVAATMTVDDPLESDDATAFVAALDPGEEARIGFHLEVTDEAIPATHPVTVDLSYRDSAGTLKESGPYRVGIEVTAQPATDVPLLPLAGAAVAVALGALWWYWRR